MPPEICVRMAVCASTGITLLGMNRADRLLLPARRFHDFGEGGALRSLHHGDDLGFLRGFAFFAVLVSFATFAPFPFLGLLSDSTGCAYSAAGVSIVTLDIVFSLPPGLAAHHFGDGNMHSAGITARRRNRRDESFL